MLALTGMKLCTNRFNGESFFSGGKLVLAPHGLLQRTIIPASSISGKFLLANSRSSAVYLGNVPFTGLAFGTRSIECSIKSVAWISLILVAKQSFQV